MDHEEKYRKIIDQYGQYHQEVQAVQELSELILLLTARPEQRSIGAYRSRIIDEVADSKIMINQIMLMHDISEAEVNSRIIYKIERQMQRIEKESEQNATD